MCKACNDKNNHGHYFMIEMFLIAFFSPQSLPDTTSHDQMEQAVKLKSDFETRDTRRQMVDITTFKSVNFQR